MLEKLIFFIYIVVSSDDRYSKNKKIPISITIFLMSFFELFLLLPIFTWTISAFNIIEIELFLSLNILTRYFLISLLLLFLYLINFYTWGKKQNMEKILIKLNSKKSKYLKYKWLMLFFALGLGGVFLITIRMLK